MERDVFVVIFMCHIYLGPPLSETCIFYSFIRQLYMSITVTTRSNLTCSVNCDSCILLFLFTTGPAKCCLW